MTLRAYKATKSQKSLLRFLRMFLLLLLSLTLNGESFSSPFGEDVFDSVRAADTMLHSGHHEALAESASPCSEDTESEMRRAESSLSSIDEALVVAVLSLPSTQWLTRESFRHIQRPSNFQFIAYIRSQGPPALV